MTAKTPKRPTRAADLMGQAKRREDKKARKAVKAARKANRR